jgi:hypothetical protein
MEMLVAEDASRPLERFLSKAGPELGVLQVPLRPLTRNEIGDHLRALFPGVALPDGFDDELARVTQGSPLFLAEIIRKLAMDKKVRRRGSQWRVEPPEEGYLPRSLEEIVSEKLVALDTRSREVLEHASTLGEDVPLSFLTGSSQIEEIKVLDLLDRAEAMGLIRLDFQLNDDSLKFLSKRILEICYGAMEPDRREALHERVGHYHEKLYNQNLVSSASILAYHFKRSSRHEKAQQYERIRVAHDQHVFDTVEAASYAGTDPDADQDPRPEPEADGSTPELDAESLPLIPRLLSSLLVAVRCHQLYPPESQSIVQARARLKEALDALLVRNEGLTLRRHERHLIANGQSLQTSDYRAVADSFVELLADSELQEIEFRRGVPESELSALLGAIGPLRREAKRSDFWERFLSDHGLEHVGLQQVRYLSAPDRPGIGERPRAGGPAVLPASEAGATPEEELGPPQLEKLPPILRSLVGAATNIKLYPLGAEQVSSAIGTLHESLLALLESQSVLTLRAIERSLLANGEKVDTQEYEVLAERFLDLLDSVGLVTLTFREGISRSELETFVEELRRHPAPDVDVDYWARFTRENTLRGLALNQASFRPGAEAPVTMTTSVTADTRREPEASVSGPEAGIEGGGEREDESVATLCQRAPREGKAMLLEGDEERLEEMLRRLFEGYRDRDAGTRGSIIQAGQLLKDDVGLALAYRFSKAAAPFLEQALTEETVPRILGEVADLLQQMSTGAIQFEDYTLASRLLLALRVRRERMEEAEDPRAESLDRGLEAPVERLVAEDLRSSEPRRQVRASQLLESLGRRGIGLLVQLVKQERDYRLRHMAATLLSRLGPEAGEALKKELVLEVTAEQRFRILEVIEAVTHDLGDELVYCLRNVNPKVRRGAFQLAERLDDEKVNEAVMEIARGDDLALAKGAIRCLGSSRSAAAVDALIDILESSQDDERRVACAQSLGHIGDDACVDALARVLSERKGLVFSRRRSSQLRSTAAFALGEIPKPEAAEVLQRFVDDSDPAVRQAARTAARDLEGEK